MKKAEAGIGTLILFIALILVAAVAAGVLIQTSTSLQNKALATGSDARTKVSTAVMFASMYATNATDATVENFFVEFRLAAGSSAINLNDTLAEFTLVNETTNLQHNVTNTTLGARCIPPVNRNYFNTVYQINTTLSRTGVIVPGDTMILCWTTRSISINEPYDFKIIPRDGSTSLISGTTPGVMTTGVVALWP